MQTFSKSMSINCMFSHSFECEWLSYQFKIWQTNIHSFRRSFPRCFFFLARVAFSFSWCQQQYSFMQKYNSTLTALSSIANQTTGLLLERWFYQELGFFLHSWSWQTDRKLFINNLCLPNSGNDYLINVLKRMWNCQGISVTSWVPYKLHQGQQSAVEQQ